MYDLAMPASPAVARWELALRLRERRTELGIKTSRITKELQVSPAYWSHIENERNLLSEDKMRPLLDLLEVTDEAEREELLALRSAAKERGWWSRYSALYGDDLLRLFGLEHGANSIQSYQNLLVPGLLQTEAYARALIDSSAFVREIDKDLAIQVRLKRQQRLHSDEPLRLTVVICEAALRQQIGGPDVHKGQLSHLASVIRNFDKTVDLRVVPFTVTGADILGASSFHLLSFTGPRLPTLGWNESVTLAGFVDGTKTRDLLAAFEQAHAKALGRGESLDLIDAILSD